MNYRHAYHAGNHADVFKHIVLCRLFNALSQKEAPFAYLDTHSGIGLYDLTSEEAERTEEWTTGIKKLLEADNLPPLLDDYIKLIQDLNHTETITIYPGSPKIAQLLSRPQDHLIFNEKHNEDLQLLKRHFRANERITIHGQDGWLLPKALLPTSEKRILILIDPPFEQPDELSRCVKTLNEAISRMRQAIVAIWYPIKDKKELNYFYNELKKTNAPKLLNIELLIKEADNSLGLNGSGMIIANPPWKLESELQVILPCLANNLGKNTGKWLINWLIEERI